MKISTSVQDNESFVPSNASTKVSGTEYEPLIDQYIPLKTKIPQSLGFSFGSSTLAIIYMANTMVIPDMNQIQNEINFESPTKLAITIIQYLSFMMCICVPSYMMIRQCERHNSPFYNQILGEINPRLGRSFLWANIVINILALFNLAIRLVNFILSSAPCMFKPTQEIVKTSADNRFFIVWSAFCVFALVIHFGIRQISYFENFNQIQGRLMLTFMGKWILFLSIFVILFAQDECGKSPVPSASIIQKFDTTSLLNYYFSIIYCLSFPFMEIFYIKRETRNDSNSSSFHTVKKVYRTQLILRASFFFMQIVFWGLLAKKLGEDFINCGGQFTIQFILMILTLITIITVGPIYANNYSINRQILNGQFLDSTKKIHQQLIDEAYTVSGFLVVLLFAAVLLIRTASDSFWAYHYVILDLTQGVQACCFAYACLILPLLVQAKQEKSPPKKILYQIFLTLSFGVFAICLAAPIMGAFDV